ncbi:MAG: hypothetical protein R3C11_01345 [Planctomycetaceae bacterium]
MVSVRVTVLPAGRVECQQVEVAPWSLFKVEDEILDSLNKELEFILVNSQILLDFQLIDHSRLKGQERAFQFIRTYPLNPTHFDISGDSIGLAIAIAAWAATQKKTLYPIVATGEIVGKEGIREIEYVKEKAEVMTMLTERIEGTLKILFPQGNHSKIFGTSLEERAVIYFSSFKHLISQHNKFLTDGFDELRSRFMVGSTNDHALNLQWNEIPVSSDPKQGFLDEDLEEIADFSKSIVEIFTGVDVIEVADSPAKEEGELSSPNARLTLPFGESPSQIVSNILYDICEAWKKVDSTKLADAPVFLHVNVADATPESLDDPIDTVISAIETTYHVQLNPVSLSNALSDQRKRLVLLVTDADRKNDQPNVWNDARYEKQKEVMQKILKWGEQENVYIFAICADYHHQLLWFGEV